jgi:hypothetical protein
LLDTFYEAGYEVPQGALAKRNTPDVDILRQHTPTPFHHSTALSGGIQRLHILRLVALNGQQTNPDGFRRDRHQQSTLADLRFNTWPNAQDELSQLWTPQSPSTDPYDRGCNVVGHRDEGMKIDIQRALDY